MNFSQIKCFLAAAEFSSFTRAADWLYISQPVLSRQIAAMEDELGFLLFTREKNTISLTAAGETMLEGLSAMSKQYKSLVERAGAVNQGFSGIINIGMIEGQLLCPPFSDGIERFRETYPDARLNLSLHSMADMRRGLQNGELDVGFGARFNAENQPGLEFILVGRARVMLVIPKAHPLAGRENLKLTDFKDETFLTLSENEFPLVVGPHSKLPEFSTKTLEAPTIGALALWLEAGFGIFPLNENHSLRNNPNLLFLQVPELNYVEEVVMWKQGNPNPLVKLLVDKFVELTD